MNQTKKKLFAERLENRMLLSANSLNESDGLPEPTEISGESPAIAVVPGDSNPDGTLDQGDTVLRRGNIPRSALTVRGADRITTEFNMIEFGSFTTHNDASGSGTFKFDVHAKTFKLQIKAEGLKANHEYVVQVTITKGLGGPDPSVYLPQGTIVSNAQGRLNFEKNHSPLDLETLVPEGADEGWRVDFQIFDPDSSNGEFTPPDNVYALICSPTTKIVLSEDGKLIPAP